LILESFFVDKDSIVQILQNIESFALNESSALSQAENAETNLIPLATSDTEYPTSFPTAIFLAPSAPEERINDIKNLKLEVSISTSPSPSEHKAAESGIKETIKPDSSISTDQKLFVSLPTLESIARETENSVEKKKIELKNMTREAAQPLRNHSDAAGPKQEFKFFSTERSLRGKLEIFKTKALEVLQTLAQPVLKPSLLNFANIDFLDDLRLTVDIEPALSCGSRASSQMCR